MHQSKSTDCLIASVRHHSGNHSSSFIWRRELILLCRGRSPRYGLLAKDSLIDKGQSIWCGTGGEASRAGFTCNCCQRWSSSVSCHLETVLLWPKDDSSIKYDVLGLRRCGRAARDGRRKRFNDVAAIQTAAAVALFAIKEENKNIKTEKRKQFWLLSSKKNCTCWLWNLGLSEFQVLNPQMCTSEPFYLNRFDFILQFSRRAAAFFESVIHFCFDFDSFSR